LESTGISRRFAAPRRLLSVRARRSHAWGAGGQARPIDTQGQTWGVSSNGTEASRSDAGSCGCPIKRPFGDTEASGLGQALFSQQNRSQQPNSGIKVPATPPRDELLRPLACIFAAIGLIPLPGRQLFERIRRPMNTAATISASMRTHT